MGELKFTPGPWRFEGDDSLDGIPYYVVAAGKDLTPSNREVAQVQATFFEGERDDFRLTPEDEANAHLIAAAPELYEALRQLKGNAEIACRHMATSEGAKIVASALFDTIGQADAILSKAIGNTTEEGRRVPHE